MKLLIIIVSITTVICTELFHYPTFQIRQTRANCTENSSIEARCYDLCALENSMMLTSEGDSINAKEFGPYYQKYADECWTFKTKPTCEETLDFLECYYEKSKLATEKSTITCKEQYPVKNLQAMEVTHELLSERQDLACHLTCLGEQAFVFNDDDTINMDCINPHISFEFDAKQAAKECEDSNKQSDKCQKRSNIFLCINRSFEKAMREDYTKKESEVTEV